MNGRSAMTTTTKPAAKKSSTAFNADERALP